MSLPILDPSAWSSRPLETAPADRESDEFPAGASEWPEELSRRRFLELMSASVAVSGLGACTRQPPEPIVAYVEQPEHVVPGRPLSFATAHLRDGFALGTLVQSHTGRPTKVEGNPDHPSSLGATDVWAQASLLELYDPDRSQAVLQRGRIRTWPAFIDALQKRLSAAAPAGSGLALLTGNTTSPTLLSQIEALLAKHPATRWYVHAPTRPDPAPAAMHPIYRLDKAKVVVSLDSDFLHTEPGSVRYAHDFAQQRRVRRHHMEMNRLYAVEPMLTVTGANADHHLPLRPSLIEPLAREVARVVGLDVEGELPTHLEAHRHWIEAVARDLGEHAGRSLILCGASMPCRVHDIIHRINEKLGNIGSTVRYVEPFDAVSMARARGVEELLEDVESGIADTLIITGCNPVYDSAADIDFARLLDRAAFSVHHGLYADETAAHCEWHVPGSHDLEAWSDARAHDGAASIIQPLIAPLYEGVGVHRLLAAVLGAPELTDHEIVRECWRQRFDADANEPGGFEQWWRRSLRDGVVDEGSLQAVDLSPLREGGRSRAVDASAPDAGDETPSPPDEHALEIVFRPDPRIWDGRYANNAWLQELPKPISQLTWDNAVMMSPQLASNLQLESEDQVVLKYRGREVGAPVWIVPSHADQTVTIHLGYGRQRSGRAGNGAGFNAYALRSTDRPWHDHGLSLRKVAGRYPLATVQHHQFLEGRHLIQHANLEEFRRDPEKVVEDETPEHSLYKPYGYEGYRWAMSIDLTTCIGCGACTIACQAENNIPVVGKEQVRRGREMHWIRVDRMFDDAASPHVYFQPVPCMHCENAPCEVVCPVGATIHSDEGLNEMIYNRCIGTRYCSNNCPYKVRRFNFLDWAPQPQKAVQLQRNPDVTVRSRGVMEKCTYCVQRIEAARIEANKERRSIRTGEIETACQQVCPTNAIVFGDMSDSEDPVSALKEQPHDYAMLAELNTRPRTTYLARIRNPNPELEGR